MDELITSLNYPTHTLQFIQIGKTIRIYCTLANEYYDDLVLRSNNIEEERIGINQLFWAIYLTDLNEKIRLFANEIDYYGYCVINDLEFEHQRWFKVGYFEGSLIEALTYSKNCSIFLLEKLFPKERIQSESYFDEIRKETQREDEERKTKFKDSSQEIKHVLEINNIIKLYHFTDKSNLKSIIKHGGLYSYEYLNKNGIKISKSSTSQISKNIDIWKGLGNYIHLGFESTHPMMYSAIKECKISNPIIFEVSIDVVFFKSTKFSNINAVSNTAIIGDDLKAFANIKFDKFHNKNYINLDPQSQKYFQAEVLVKEHISKNLILNYNQILTNKM